MKRILFGISFCFLIGLAFGFIFAPQNLDNSSTANAGYLDIKGTGLTSVQFINPRENEQITFTEQDNTPTDGKVFLSYLQITKEATDKIYLQVGSEDVLLDESGTSYNATLTGHYKVKDNGNNIIAACDFSPKFYTSDAFVSIDSEYYIIDRQGTNIFSTNDKFTSCSENIVSSTSGEQTLSVTSKDNEIFYFNFKVVITSDIAFFNSSEFNANLPSLDKTSENPYNIFNSEVYLKIENLNTLNYVIEGDNNYTLLSKEGNVSKYKFNEAQNSVYKINITGKNGTQRTIKTFKIITEFRDLNKYIRIHFDNATNESSFNYVDYFLSKSKVYTINSSNRTITSYGNKNLILIKNPSEANVVISGNTAYLHASTIEDSFAVMFDIQNKGVLPDYSFNNNTNTLIANNLNGKDVYMHIYYNGLSFTYSFKNSTKNEIVFTEPGTYTIEIYGFQEYSVIENAWDELKSTGDKYENYLIVKEYSSNYVKRKVFTIDPITSYIVASTTSGVGLYNKQIVTSDVRVAIKNARSITYKVYKDNTFFSDEIENLNTDDGAVFDSPGNYKIDLANGKSFEFTIIKSRMMNFSFYADPAIYKNLDVTYINKNGDTSTIEANDNNFFHFTNEGYYTVSTSYNYSIIQGITTETPISFSFEIKKSNLSITLANGVSGDRVSTDIVISEIYSEVTPVKLVVYLNNKAIFTYGRDDLANFASLSEKDRTFSQNGDYTIVLYDEYDNSYSVSITKYYKMNAVTVILIVVGSIALVVVTVFIFLVRRNVKVK